jgi:hypothetical protein
MKVGAGDLVVADIVDLKSAGVRVAQDHVGFAGYAAEVFETTKGQRGPVLGTIIAVRGSELGCQVVKIFTIRRSEVRGLARRPTALKNRASFDRSPCFVGIPVPVRGRFC